MTRIAKARALERENLRFRPKSRDSAPDGLNGERDPGAFQKNLSAYYQSFFDKPYTKFYSNRE